MALRETSACPSEDYLELEFQQTKKIDVVAENLNFNTLSPERRAGPASAPDIVHRFRDSGSILCLAVDGEFIYAGTENGDLLVSE